MMLLSALAYEKLSWQIYMNLPCVEQYFSNFGIKFDLPEIEDYVKRSCFGRKQEDLKLLISMVYESMQLQIDGVSSSKKSIIANALCNIIYTRLMKYNERASSALYLNKILLILQERDQNDNAFLFLWNKLLAYCDIRTQQDIDAGYYDKNLAEFLKSNDEDIRTCAKTMISNYANHKILLIQTFNYWSQKYESTMP